MERGYITKSDFFLQILPATRFSFFTSFHAKASLGRIKQKFMRWLNICKLSSHTITLSLNF
jgi:hypothetical protein